MSSAGDSGGGPAVSPQGASVPLARTLSRLRRRSIRRGSAAAAFVLSALVTAGCGFHLRGTGGNMVLPPSLSSLRVVMAGPAANEPLAAAVRDVLAQAGARVVDANDVPTLVLLGEQVESRVASVSTATAKASEYLLQYSAAFRLDGPHPIPAQTVRLQRDYSFNPNQVLAQEQQERELVRNMRREAAQQIVRRLGRALRPNTR